MWQIMIKAQIRDVGGDALTNNGFKPPKNGKNWKILFLSSLNVSNLANLLIFLIKNDIKKNTGSQPNLESV